MLSRSKPGKSSIIRAIRWVSPLIIVILALGYGAVSYFMAAGLTKVERKPLENDPMDYGLGVQDVEFSSRTGDVALSGWYIPVSTKGEPTIIFVHGLSGNRAGDNDMKLARRLADSGFGVLLFDLRGHGSSEGERASGGYHERQDLLGAFDFLVRREIPSNRVGIHGFSFGAGIALLAVADEPSIGAIVADSPFADVSELVAQETARATGFPQAVVPVFIPGMKMTANLLYGIKLEEIVPQEAVARVDYPVLLIHGMADSRIPKQHSVRIHSASHPDSDLWLAPNVGHTEAFSTYPDEYAAKVLSYFRARLGSE